MSIKRKHGLGSLSVRVCALAFVYGSNYVVERFRALAPKKGCFKIVNSMIRKFVSRLDDNRWFVYRHVSSQTKWIDLRAKTPRDKSKVMISTQARAKSLGRVGEVSVIIIYQELHRILIRNGLYRDIVHL